MLSHIKSHYSSQYMESEQKVIIRSRIFMEEQLAICFWTIIFMLMLLLSLLIQRQFSDDSIVITRNPFGQGDRQQNLILHDKSGQDEISVRVEEEALTASQTEALYDSFFSDLKKHMSGANKSLGCVSSSLIFDNTLEGYPFEIEYQPEDLSLIDLSGKPGQEMLKLKGEETKDTSVKVTAAYRQWKQSRDFSVTLVSSKKAYRPSVFDKAAEQIGQIEKKSRDKASFTLPDQILGVTIQIPEKDGKVRVLILLGFAIPVFVIIRRYYRLKENTIRIKREEEEDFPVIVHLFVLYMKAGLSFASAIHRISQQNSISDKKGMERTAFEEIRLMQRQLMMGESQKNVCVNWGKRTRHPLYRKLSSVLIQILVKGTREGEQLLEQMEGEAFTQRIDRVRREGKRAETKLVFPMIILLCLVMIIVLFPAMIRFQVF